MPATPLRSVTRLGRVGDFARRLLFLLALLVIACAVLLLVAERSGRLTSEVQQRLSARLHDEVAIDHLRLSWFTPGVDVEGMHLRDAPELANIESASAQFSWNGFAMPVLQRLELRGGRVQLSEQFFQRVERIAAAMTEQPEQPRRPVPLIVVRDVQLQLAHPAWGQIDLGRVDALLRLNEEHKLVLEGRIAPQFAGAEHEIYLRSSRDESGLIDILASTADMPVSAQAFPIGTPLEPVRAWQPRANLAFEVRASFDPTGAREPSGHLRAVLDHGSMQAPQTSAPVTDIALDVDAHCTPHELGLLLDPHSWECTAHLEATWAKAPLDAWALVGRNAGENLAARAWFVAPRFDLSRDFLAAIGVGDRIEESWHALEPRGVASFACGLRWPIDAAQNDFAKAADPIATFDVELGGEAGVTYFGWPNAHHRTEGFPLPVDKLTGRIVALHDARLEHATQIAFVRVLGAHSGGTAEEQPAFAEGLVALAKPGTDHSLFDLRFGAQGVPIDDHVRDALDGLEGAQFVYPDFSPRGGTASVAARIVFDEVRRAPAGRVELSMNGVDGTWRELPVPVHGLTGSIDILIDPRHLIGSGIELRGETAAGADVRIFGRVQDDPAPQLANTEWRARRISAFDVALDAFPLRGADRDALASTLPEIGAELDKYGAQGKADARYTGATLSTGAAYEYRVEVTPRQIQITPDEFRVQARGVRGRVLAVGRNEVHPTPESPGVGIRIAPLVGDWPAGARVGVLADMPARDDGTLQLFGAGIDLTNTGLVGAFRESLQLNAASGYGGVDLAALDVDGRVDFTGSVSLPRAAPRKPQSSYRVYLRDNDIAIGAADGAEKPPSGASANVRGLGHFNGILVQKDEQLFGQRITATLSGSPLILTRARFFERDGVVHLETGVRADDLPLDAQHLGFFLDQKTVRALVDELHLRGSVDIDHAQLTIAGTPGSPSGSVRFSGNIAATDTFIDLGLPLEIDTASVDVSDLMYEGGHVRLDAAVDRLNGRVADRRLEDTHLRFTYVEPHLSVLELRGTFEDGKLRPMLGRSTQSSSAFSIDLAAPFPFELAMRLDDVEVGGLLRGVFESDFASTGLLSSELRLAGDLEHMTGLRGDGSVELRDTTLWSIPVVREMFARLGFDSAAVFERVRSRFRLADGVLHISDLHVYSPLLQLVGEGTLDFDGTLHQDLEVRYALVDKLGPLRRFLYWVQNNLLRVSVRGSMSRPRVLIKGMLGVMQEDKGIEHALPLPSYAPLPPRF